jgi:hypothetical protein
MAGRFTGLILIELGISFTGEHKKVFSLLVCEFAFGWFTVN